MSKMNMPGFTAETSFSGFSGEFRMVAPRKIALTDRTVTMAQAQIQCCPRNNHCPSACVEDVSSMCTQSWHRWYDPWYTRCQDYKKYVTTGDLVPVDVDYWCGYGEPIYAHYSPCY